MKKDFDAEPDFLREEEVKLMREAARIIDEQETERWEKAPEKYAHIAFPESLDEKIYALIDEFDRKKNLIKG